MSALDGISVGARVRFHRHNFTITGELERFEDDSHEFLSSVEGWANIKLPDGSTRTFRRGGGLGPNDWRGVAKSLRDVGYLKIELLRPSAL